MAPWNGNPLLKADPLDWLLEEDNPSVRYFALCWLLERPAEDPQVEQAAHQIASLPGVRSLLEKQKPAGYWGPKAHPHNTDGPLMLLHWLGVPRCAEIERALEYRAAGCIAEDGAYRYRYPDKDLAVDMPCHGAELLRELVDYGYANDAGTTRLLAWLVSVQQADGSFLCLPKANAFTCGWASAAVLRALRALPPALLAPPVTAARDRMVAMFLDAGICLPGLSRRDPHWFQFGFPLQWDSDILDVLELVAPQVAPDDARIQPALARVLEKQDAQGRWPCEKPPRRAKWMEAYTPLEAVGQPSKWVTLHALNMLKLLSANAPREPL